jgi:hypothetical protein
MLEEQPWADALDLWCLSFCIGMLKRVNGYVCLPTLGMTTQI